MEIHNFLSNLLKGAPSHERKHASGPFGKQNDILQQSQEKYHSFEETLQLKKRCSIDSDSSLQKVHKLSSIPGVPNLKSLFSVESPKKYQPNMELSTRWSEGCGSLYDKVEGVET